MQIIKQFLRCKFTIAMLMVCVTIHVAKGQTTVTIGNGTSTDYSNPFETYFNYGWSSQLYLKSEIGASGSISAIGYYVSNSGPTYTLDNQKIYVRHSSLASFADKYYPTTTGFTLVYSGSITFGASGWKTVVFNTPFAYNGVDNLEIMVESRDGSTFTSAIQSRYTSQAGGSIYRTKYDYNDYSFPTTYQAGGRVQHYSNVQFTINTCTYTGGTASASASTVCSGGSSTLSLTGNSGTPIQWQSSTDNITFTDVLGETSASYAASNLTASKYYRAKIGSGSCIVYSTSTLVTVNSNPTADAGSALTAICQSGTTSAMGGSIGGGATSGSWTGGAGTWTNATNPSIATYTASATETGTITLTLTTSGGNCGTTTATKTLIINSNPTQNTTTPSNVNVCRGETVLFTSSTLGSNETIQWQESSDNATFTNLSGETNLTYRAENITSSKYIRSVLSLGTCSYTGTSHTITVLSSPTSLTLTAGKVSIASGESSTLIASGATNYTWDHNLGNVASVSVSPTGTTTYTVTGNNGNSCTETATITITVNGTTSSINTVQVGTLGNGTDYSNPFQTYFNFGWSTQLYLASELNKTGKITSLAYYVNNSGGSYTLDNQKVYVRHTALSSYTDNLHPGNSGFTLVYEGSITFGASGWNTIPFSTAFDYNGTDNLEVLIESRDASTFTSAIQTRYTNQSGTSIYRTKYYYDNDNFPSLTASGLKIHHFSTAQFTINTCTITAGTVTANVSSVCSGGNVTLQVNNQTAGQNIQWQFSSDDVTYTDISNQTASTYNATNVASAGYYRVKVGSGTCILNSAGISIGVLVAPNPGTISADKDSICQYEKVNLSLTGQDANSVLQWQVSIDGSTFTNLNGKTISTLLTDELPSTTYFRVSVSNTSCTSFSANKLITISCPTVSSFNATTGKGSLHVDISTIQDKVGPFHYIISSYPIDNLKDQFAYLRDSVFVGDTSHIDSTRFFTGNISTTSYNFNNLDMGEYYTSVFDSRGICLFDSKNLVLPTMPFTELEGVQTGTRSITSIEDNAKGTLDLLINNQTQSEIKFTVNEIQNDQYFGFLPSEATLQNKNSIQNGFAIENSKLYLIIDGNKTEGSIQITPNSTLSLKQNGNLLEYYDGTTILKQTPLPQAYSWKTSFVFNASNSSLEFLPHRYLFGIPFIINHSITDNTCDKALVNLTVSYPTTTSQYPTSVYLYDSKNIKIGTENQTYYESLPIGIYYLKGTAYELQHFGDKELIEINNIVYAGLKVKWEKSINNTSNDANGGDVYWTKYFNQSDIIKYTLAKSSNKLDEFSNEGWFSFVPKLNGLGNYHKIELVENPIIGLTNAQFNIYFYPKSNRCEINIGGQSEYLFYKDNTPILVRRKKSDLKQNETTFYFSGGISAEITTTAKINSLSISPYINSKGSGFMDFISSFGCEESQVNYAKLKYELDGYYNTFNNNINFVFNQEYNSSVLNFKIFNKKNQLVSTQSDYISMPITHGDNYISIPISNLIRTSCIPNGFYYLETMNDKKEKMYLRFILDIESNPCSNIWNPGDQPRPIDNPSSSYGNIYITEPYSPIWYNYNTKIQTYNF